MKKLLMVLVLFLGGGVGVFGQRLEDMTNIPATPQTTALFKAVATPVSYYTGQPDISIPIYTISQDGVEVPISISFNTSGIFVNEEATSIGIGVRLNWGGSIVRSANGRPDERGFFTEAYNMRDLIQELPKDYSNTTGSTPVLFYPYIGNPASFQTVIDRLSKYHGVNTYNDPYKDGTNGFATDLRPDDFYYNVLGKSGLFKFNQADRKFVTFPLDDIKIEQVSTPNEIQKFEITKSDGVKIILGDGAVESTVVLGPIFDQSWFVKKITTIKNSTIDFSYIDNQFSKQNDDRAELRETGDGSNLITSGGEAYFNNEKLIQSINFKEGRVDFIYVRDRTDIDLNAPNTPNAGLASPRLDKIELTDINNKRIRTFQFYQSYFVGNPSSGFDLPKYNNRLRLDSLAINDNAANSIEKYKFEYNSSTNIPSKKSLARDHWGYYNGANNNQALIPASLIPFTGGFLPYNNPTAFSSANRYINSATNKVFTIKKIQFPTGGTREYNFEDNEVGSSELYPKMKDISNDGYNMLNQEFIVRGQTLSDCYPTPAVINSNNTERTVYSNEFNMGEFHDLVLGDPSLYIETTFINPAITTSQLNNWAYQITIGLQRQSGGIFSDYMNLAALNRTDPILGNIFRGKLTYLPSGIYRIFVKLSTPPIYVMNNWLDIYGHVLQYSHNTIVRLAWREKNLSNIKIGGLRIKEIIDRESTNQYKTTYDYIRAGNCSGQLINIPEYIEYIQYSNPAHSSTSNPFGLFYGYRICSESVFPITKTQGSNVGYTNVIKRQIGSAEEIKEEFTFSFKPSIQTGYLQEYYKETKPRSWQDGKLLSDKKFSNNILISQDSIDYYGLINETDKGFVEEINTGLIKGGVYSSAGFPDDVLDISIDRRHDNPVFNYTLPGSTQKANVPVFLYYVDNANFAYDPNVGIVVVDPPVKIPYFKTYTGFDKIKSRTTKNYSGTNVITQTENYFYDGIPTNLGMSRLEMVNSQDEILASKFYYPQDLAVEPFMAQMVNANRIESPIKTEKFKSGRKLFEEKLIYSQDASTSNLLLPKFVYSSNFPNTNPNITNPPVGQLEKKITYDLFDFKGNILQYHEENEIFTTIIWGYNSIYPVAKIIGSNYATVSSLINQSILDNPGDDVAMRTELNKLRSATILANAFVSTYSFAPLIGMTSQTDPNGLTTYYEYDSFGRLKLVKDKDGKILKTYNYHYKN